MCASETPLDYTGRYTASRFLGSEHIEEPVRVRSAAPVRVRSAAPAQVRTAVLAQVRAGSEVAVRALVKQNNRRLYRAARAIVRDDAEAEDVVQETYVRAFSALDGFEERSSVSTWLTRIAVNEALMKLRKRKTDRTVSLDEPVDLGEDVMQREIAVWDGNPEQQYSGEEMKKILEDALDSLKPDFRTVFTLRDIEALSTEETADALGISVAAVKSRLLRARLALREKLTRQFKRKGGNAFDYM